MENKPVTVANHPATRAAPPTTAKCEYCGRVSRGRVVRSWSTATRRAIELGDGDAAYRLTVAFVGRLRELGAPV
jgi:hypothetical protein